MPRKKTLLEELAELNSPRPVHEDPEDLSSTTGKNPLLEDTASGVDVDGQETEGQTPGRIRKSLGLPVINDPRYSGRKISRAALEDDSEESGGESSESESSEADAGDEPKEDREEEGDAESDSWMDDGEDLLAKSR